MSSEISEEVKEMVRKCGDEVALHEPPCVLWKADHENCVGCQYELGCGKVAHILLIIIDPYEPKDYDDHLKKQRHIFDLTDRTLEAKTPDELHLVTPMTRI